MKIAIVTSRFPYPLEKGDKLRIFHLAKGLAINHDVHIISLSKTEIQSKDYEILSDLNIHHYNYPVSFTKRVVNVLFAYFKELPFQISYFYDQRVAKEIEEKLKLISPECIVTHLPRTALYTKNSQLPNLIDYMDAFSASYARVGAQKSWPLSVLYTAEAKKMKKFEAQIASSFDAKTIISVQDKNLLEGHVGELSVISNGVDTEFFKPQKHITKDHDLVFVGNLGYQPNKIAVNYILDRILPKLIKRVPDIKVLIAGARPDKHMLKAASNNVTVIPWLDDIRDAYSRAKIFLAPIFTGAGQQNKILEAMSMQLPCVTTQQVADGIGHIDEDIIFKCERADDFVEVCLNLIAKPNETSAFGESGRAMVKEHYSWDRSIGLLEAELLKII